LKAAEVLHSAQLYDQAVYVCGYAVEFALKNRICRALKWSGYPPAQGQGFKGLESFKTHKLDSLLLVSGCHDRIADNKDWNLVRNTWSPKMRYDLNFGVLKQDARDFIDAVRRLVSVLCER